MSTDLRHSLRTEIDEAAAATTLVDVLRRNAALHRTAPAIHWKEEGNWKLLNWAAAAQTFDYRGWVHTGDLGPVDSDGSFQSSVARRTPSSRRRARTSC